MGGGAAKTTGASGGGGGFKARLEHYMFSGQQKHVFAGIAIVSALLAVPWVLMNRGSKHQSHQDYMEKANKARSERLSSGQPTIK
ncbi:hypothetical protein Cni_G27854 [Canna indica]|uniref:GAG1At protein n=1 Tax=Canna indica TaxID=4628 RepID=A0AAQ3L4L5_9LILI|nr:hypothetical protein Cni_G27854 [Canna indica]